MILATNVIAKVVMPDIFINLSERNCRLLGSPFEG